MTLLDRVTDRLMLAWGWKRAGIAFALGAVSALAVPPFGFAPVLLLTFPGLVLLLDGVAPRAGSGVWTTAGPAFITGWSFGFGYFLAGLWWIGAAFLVDADVFAWLLPLGVAGLPALLAVFTGVGTVLARLIWPAGPLRVAALAFGLGLSEHLRGILFTGFPWNAFGTALTTHDVTAQAASLIGLDALTVLAVFCAAAPAALLPWGSPGKRARVAVVGAAVAILCGVTAFGVLRLTFADEQTVAGVTVRLVQPNLTQQERRNPQSHPDIFERYLRLTSAPPPDGAPRPTHIVWPESSLPFLVDGAPGILSRIQSALTPGTMLIAGLQRPDESGERVFNSLYVFDDQARIVERYDKLHLVPFGEYLPFPDMMAAVGLEPLTRVFAFVPGTRRVPLAAGAAGPFIPLICYEAIFSGAVLRGGERPQWIVNISDDSWFGRTIGPAQHMHQARLRAVEEGLPLVRATTTGISVVVDGYGRLRGSIELGVEGFLDTSLPVALPPTLFSVVRSIPVYTLLFAMFFFALFARFNVRTA